MNAVNRYAWRWMNDYWYAVIVYRQTIAKTRWFELPKFSKEIEKVKEGKWAAKVNWVRENTKDTYAKTKKALDNLNPRLDDKEISYQEYIDYITWQCNNYWLDDYISYDKNHPYNLK